MPNQFYAGHDIQWMQRFLDAVPEGRRFQKPIAYCLACCIHHHFVYTKHDVVRLNHEKLQQFGLIRQRLKRYLQVFKDAGLIDYYIGKGRVPIVSLVHLPSTYYKINSTNQTKYIIQDTGVTSVTGTCYKNDRLPVTKTTGYDYRSRTKGTHPPRQGTKVGKGGRKRGNPLKKRKKVGV